MTSNYRWKWCLAGFVAVGCASGPPVDRSQPATVAVLEQDFENPILISPGIGDPITYADIFERVLSVVGDYFEIAYPNRYDGRIVTLPKLAPGYEQFWKPGSPNIRERLLDTIQTMRYRCTVQIRAAQAGGYYVQVTVLKELKDDPQPALPYAGRASFQESPTIERQFEVVDPNAVSTGERWIPKGRDYALEREILRKIQRCQ
ncbi:hypothetical protein KIH39_11030 [Telmatocola sphagniphila]|uniref:Uncharacterized protein n=1 Tax=Telmatocola sphagniphila TaxID=1123043 RepID=A0A8E6B921_9BACT|nr:hypothetical protein [Telmatocola sphagniphila]QVL34410.1 hypothetical protein KIH39_11030 [Telmatocola sphagniphila]